MPCAPSCETICGIDEAGRGPLVGPVVAACVIIPDDVRNLDFWSIVTDSKKLSAKKREMLSPLIRQHCPYGIAEASAAEIDELNIHHATLLAMKRAFEALLLSPHPPAASDGPLPLPQGEGNEACCHKPAHDGIDEWVREKRLTALIDGKFCPDLPCAAEAVVGGDGKVLEISAASILAKVARDHMIKELHGDFPRYGWDRNSGYGTAEHLAALERHGPTPHHRRSFAPIKKYAVVA